jgi:hypothetical protein
MAAPLTFRREVGEEVKLSTSPALFICVYYVLSSKAISFVYMYRYM